MFIVFLLTILGFVGGLLWVLSRQKLTFGEALKRSLLDLAQKWRKGEGDGGTEVFHNGRWYKG